MDEELDEGTAIGAHRPPGSRYSPTDVGPTLALDVPTARHEFDAVQAIAESGTEMLIDGVPDAWARATLTVPHAASAREATTTATNCPVARALAGTRLMASSRSGRPLSLD